MAAAAPHLNGRLSKTSSVCLPFSYQQDGVGVKGNTLGQREIKLWCRSAETTASLAESSWMMMVMTYEGKHTVYKN